MEMEDSSDIKSQVERIVKDVREGANEIGEGSFCEQCRLLDASISTLEALLASRQELGPQVSKKTTVPLGPRSKFGIRAGKCPGCRSILAAFDFHLPEDFQARHEKYVMKDDYELSLVVDPKNTGAAYSAPLSITTNGISGMILRPTVKYPPLEAIGRPCDPQKLDYSMIQKWITCCENSHQDTCENSLIDGMTAPTSQVKYIDLERSCLVAFAKPPRYVALSYVWGQVPTLMTKKSNVNQLSQANSLIEQAKSIPRTIRDAMTLTRQLGVRYLWVDALCIVQDDLEGKQDHLNHMPSIYERAYFTLAIVDGSNAECGIPGVGQDPLPRSVPPKIVLPSKTVSIVTEHYNRMKFMQRMGIGYKPIWSTRAWTMQEQMFSKRILLIQGLASWMCLRTQWLEELERPSENPEWAKVKPPDQRYRLGNPGRIQMSSLGKLINEYNERQLSFEEDVADAFLGVASLYKPIFGPLHFGLPETLFDHALCWKPSPGLRQGIRKRLPTNPARKVPSWSWMGWHGSLDVALWEVFQDHEIETFGDRKRAPFLGFDIHIKPMTTFYKSCITCLKNYPISNSYHNCRKGDDIPSGWIRTGAPAHWNGKPKYYYEREAERQKIPYRYPIVHYPEDHSCIAPVFDTTLTFRAHRQFFSVAVRSDCKRTYNLPKTNNIPDTNTNSVVDAHIMDDYGQRVGIITLSDHEDPIEIRQCELIAISEGECPSRDFEGNKWGKQWVLGREHPFREDVDVEFDEVYRFVNVLWIEWQDGVTYRNALGRVRKAAWIEGLSGLSEKEKNIEVTLG